MEPQELLALIRRIRALDLRTTSVEEIRALLETIPREGFRIPAIRLEGPAKFYRIIRYDAPPPQLRDLSYPPADIINRDGRFNRAGNPIFYCSEKPDAAYSESRLSVGDRFVWVVWESTAVIHFPIYGFTYATLLGMGTSVPIPWAIADPPSQTMGIYTEFMASEFTRTVTVGNEHLYKISIAFAEMLLDIPTPNHLDAGFGYPTVQMSGDGLNYAIRPRIADDAMRFVEASFCEVVSIDAGDGRQSIKTEVSSPDTNGLVYVTENNPFIQCLDYAPSADDDGNLDWLGRAGKWPWLRKKEKVTAGRRGVFLVLLDEDDELVKRR